MNIYIYKYTYRGYLLLIYNFEDHLMIEFPVTGGET